MTAALAYEKYTILVVDDNPTNLSVVSDYLDTVGFEVMVASDGSLGLQRATKAKPDLILSDVMMPVMDGFEMCRQLKADEATRDIPVIFMTALSETDKKVTGFEAGAVDYVTKPLQHEEVLLRVTTHLRLIDLMKQLHRANAGLTEAIAAKDKFFSILAHDLRGPFNSLLGLSEFLTSEVDTAPRPALKEMTESIHRSTRNAYNLLENLLDWARLQRDRIEFSPDPLHLGEAARRNIELLHPTAAAKAIRLENHVAEEMVVLADPHMLDTILRNLISNALKFTPGGGRVKLSAYRNKQRVDVSVTDTGVGISPENLQKLFKLAENFTTVGTAQEKGTGLGMIVCQELVAKNGGEIWVDSQVGAGTTVTFTLPLPAEAASA